MSESAETLNAAGLSEANRRKSVRSYCATHWNVSPMRVAAETLSFPLAATYLALLRSCEVFDNDKLRPIDSAAVRFVPDVEFGKELLRDIEGAGLLAVSDVSGLNAFKFEGDQVHKYYPYSVVRRIMVENPMDLLAEISDHALSGRWPAHWYDQAADFWKQLALAEAREFLLHTLDTRRMPTPDDGRTGALFRDMLRDHSVAQCFHLIMTAAKETSDQLIRKRLRGQQIANFMLECCQRSLDSARTERRVVPGESRPDDLPQSTVSFIIHNVFLKTGDKGFTRVPAYPIEDTNRHP